MGSGFPLTGLRSVEIATPDLAAAAEFYTQVWGLREAARDATQVWLRASGTDPYVLRLTRGATVGVLSVTFRAAEGTDLAALRAQMIAAGGTAEGDIGALVDLGGGTGFALRDPSGRRYRVVQGDARASRLGDGDGAMPDRLAHVNINTRDLAADIAFFEQGLGFRLSDRSKMMGFLCTNSDHHAVVLAIAGVDTLNHVAFNHPDWESVMRASGRMCDAGFGIGWGPGRHGPGDNVFLYFVDPFGMVVEHTAEVLQVDDSYRPGGPEDWTWPAGRSDQWGIAPPKTDACKSAQLAVAFL
ncbi:VOC family protein [Salipiger mangrovisoli]|uniref:VOC family protein n=1 Tax=Salipiger mangrovisoli TaxID=2865933 RepID=A0ABR9X124_9RHOB|nr:VOC family protein [Salipiger mangrovisoli]MBE9637192.1 VOC family protein [Salipiger mangrovisoli]